ncbi:TPA: CpaF family protein, partial [Vibrio harveyi]
MSSNKDLYLAFRGQIFEALDAEAVQKMSRRDLEAQIQAAVDLLANSYQRPITSM